MQLCITLYILFDAVEAHACSLLKLFSFNIYIYNTFRQNVMVEGGCVQNLWPFLYSTLVKTLKNWMCYKIKSLDSFSLKFWRNSHNDDTKMLKIWNFQKFQISTPPPRNPNFPNFGPKFPDRYLLVYFQIIYFLKALYSSFL